MSFAMPDYFANARNDFDDTDPSRGQRLEIRMYEGRYDSQGHRVVLGTGVRRKDWSAVGYDQYPEAALSVTRFYDRDRELEYTQMEVRSPYIRTALRAVIKEYSGLTFETGMILIRNEPRCIFHYRDEIRDYGLGLEDPTATQHLLFFLNYMYQSLSREITSYYNFMESPTVAPGIEHEFLWMAFRPGSLLFYTTRGVQSVVRFHSMQLNRRGEWDVRVEKLGYNGDLFGRIRTSVFIHWYDGYKPLQELDLYPLRYHADQQDMMQAMVTRGHKYVSLTKMSHQFYSGVADTLSPYRTTDFTGDEDYPLQPITVRGRVMVDFKKFALARSSHKKHIAPSDKVKLNANGEPVLTDEEWCLFDSEVPGYSFTAKRWCFFELDRMASFEYNTRAFQSLALPNEQKDMLESLVRAQSEDLQFDDIIKGKGKGLIFLLHGEPGVGKTLTAESLSDYTKRPLYSVSCGDLGTTATACERALDEILDLATCWNAILLIDEADVFLEQRSSHDLNRNGCVAVFLRLLEYFEGIMFLTTNRIMHFDAAFKSRIHLAIKYPGLSSQSQRQLWTTFITNDSQRPAPHWLDGTLLDDVADRALNGRQIKNVVRTAMALAVAAGRELKPEDIKTSLKAMEDFEKDFAEALQGRRVLDHGRDVHDYEVVSQTESGQKRKRFA